MISSLRARATGPAAGMAAATTLSRATGLIRTLCLAYALGVTPLADAYNVANTTPNMLFQLVAGGVLASALIPLLVRFSDPRERCEASGAVLGAVAAVGGVASIVMALASPVLVRILTAGAQDQPGYENFVALGEFWMRVFAIQIFLYAISTGATGIMSSHRRLTLGAAAPVLTNVIVSGAALLFAQRSAGASPTPETITSGDTALLGWSTTIAVAVMAAVQLWGAFRTEPGLRFSLRLRHPTVRRLVRNGGWVLVYVGANQIGLAIVMAFASNVPGGISAYQWAFAIMQLPFAIITVSLISSAFPLISKAASDGNDVSREAFGPVRTGALFLLPAAGGLALVAEPVAAVLVSGEGTELIAGALRGFAVSLVPFSFFQLLTRTSYAFEDVRMPAFVNIAVNVVVTLATFGTLNAVSSDEARLTGFGLSHGAAYLAGCVLLSMVLVRAGRLHFTGFPLTPVVQATLATVAMIAFVYVVGLAGGESDSRFDAVLRCVLLGVAGTASYVAVLTGLRTATKRLSSLQRQ